MTEPTSSNTSIVIAILIVGVLVAGTILYSGGAFKAPRDDDPMQIEMERAVVSELTDPGSAEFRNVRKSTIGYCGEVNAKNRMGGYVGFKSFTAFKDSNTGKWQNTYDPRLVGVMCK